jgi:hypothetical protein
MRAGADSAQQVIMQTRILLRTRVKCAGIGCAGEGFAALQLSVGGPACMVPMGAARAGGCKRIREWALDYGS